MFAYAAPGRPTNLHTTEVDCDSITICWNYPYDDPQCAFTHEEDIKENVDGAKNQAYPSRSFQIEDDFCITFNSLRPNTEYRMKVWFISQFGEVGEFAETQQLTLPICT